MNDTDRAIFEALDYLYILGEFDEYQEAVELFYRFTELREPIPKDIKKKMAEALKKKRTEE